MCLCCVVCTWIFKSSANKSQCLNLIFTERWSSFCWFVDLLVQSTCLWHYFLSKLILTCEKCHGFFHAVCRNISKCLFKPPVFKNLWREFDQSTSNQNDKKQHPNQMFEMWTRKWRLQWGWWYLGVNSPTIVTFQLKFKIATKLLQILTWWTYQKTHNHILFQNLLPITHF